MFSYAGDFSLLAYLITFPQAGIKDIRLENIMLVLRGGKGLLVFSYESTSE